MSRATRLLPAIAGASPAAAGTPPKTLQINLTRIEPRDGWCALIRLDRGIYAAGMPEIVPLVLHRPLIAGAVTRTSLNLAAARYTMTRDAS